MTKKLFNIDEQLKDGVITISFVVHIPEEGDHLEGDETGFVQSRSFKFDLEGNIDDFIDYLTQYKGKEGVCVADLCEIGAVK